MFHFFIVRFSGISKYNITTEHLIKSWLPEKLGAGFFPVLLPKVLDRVGRMEQGKALHYWF